MEPTKIPKFEKISDVKEQFRKNLNEDTVFKFECVYLDSQDKLLLRASEINNYTPFYYEELFTLNDIYEIGEMFRSRKSLSELPNHIKTMFAGQKTKLEMNDDKSILTIISEAYDITTLVEVKFKLKKKTVEDKDNALKNLYIVTKNNEEKLNECLNLCKKHNEPLFKELTELLKKN